MEKRRVKLTVKDDSVEWLVIKFLQDDIIADFPIRVNDVFIEETGQDGVEANVQEGDVCLAPYSDKRLYKAKILRRTDEKEVALKDINALKKNTHGNNDSEKKQKKKKEPTDEEQIQRAEDKEKEQKKKRAATKDNSAEENENTQKKKKVSKKKENESDSVGDESIKKKKKELAEEKKKQREALSNTAQTVASMLFSKMKDTPTISTSLPQTPANIQQTTNNLLPHDPSNTSSQILTNPFPQTLVNTYQTLTNPIPHTPNNALPKTFPQTTTNPLQQTTTNTIPKIQTPPLSQAMINTISPTLSKPLPQTSANTIPQTPINSLTQITTNPQQQTSNNIPQTQTIPLSQTTTYTIPQTPTKPYQKTPANTTPQTPTNTLLQTSNNIPQTGTITLSQTTTNTIQHSPTKPLPQTPTNTTTQSTTNYLPQNSTQILQHTTTNIIPQTTNNTSFQFQSNTLPQPKFFTPLRDIHPSSHSNIINQNDSMTYNNFIATSHASSDDIDMASALSMSFAIDDYSENCPKCDIKDRIIKDLKFEIRNLQSQLDDATSELNDMKITNAPLTPLTQEREKTYHPKTRPRIHFAKYHEVDSSNPVIQTGYQPLAPGASIAVDALWLHSTLAAVKKKKGYDSETNSCIVKKLMDGFYDLEELSADGGSKVFRDSKIYKSLMLYAEHSLNMGQAHFTKAWNEKMGAARKTKKRLEKNFVL